MPRLIQSSAANTHDGRAWAPITVVGSQGSESVILHSRAVAYPPLVGANASNCRLRRQNPPLPPFGGGVGRGVSHNNRTPKVKAGVSACRTYWRPGARRY